MKKARDVFAGKEERVIVDLKELGIPDAILLGRYRYIKAHPILESHRHEGQMEICYCSKGEQVYEVENKKYVITGGDVFITFPGENHSSAGYPEGRGELYWLIFDLRLKRDRFLSFENEQASGLVTALTELQEKRHFKGSSRMKPLLEEIIKFSAINGSLQIVRITSLLTNFLLAVIDASARKFPEATPAVLNTILKDIQANPGVSYSVRELASRVHLSESRFKSWFKEQTGFPPMEYVMRQRIKKAEELLLSKKKVSEVTYELGFSSVQHFSHTFKKVKGRSPTDWLSRLQV